VAGWLGAEPRDIPRHHKPKWELLPFAELLSIKKAAAMHPIANKFACINL
jgi:hypothetical protein